MSSSLISTTKLDGRRLGLPNIAFTGRAGAGKTTASQLLQQLFDYEIRSFAAPLKYVASVIWGDAAQTDRDKLQRLGVAVREIDPNAWVNCFLQRTAEERKTVAVVVDDLRFENEWWSLKAEGFVIVQLRAPRTIRINRLKSNGKWQNEEQLEHISETSLDHLIPDVAIENDGSEFDLYDKLADTVAKLQRKR